MKGMTFSNRKCELSQRSVVGGSGARPGIRLLAAKCALLIVGGAAAFASNAADAPRRENNYELTPFVGYMGGGRFADPTDNSDRDVKEDTLIGLFADIVADTPERHYEVLYANQGSTIEGATPIDMSIQYLQIGGTVGFTDNPRVTPYFGATVGATRFSPDTTGLDDETKLSFSLGGGMKIPITDHIGLRFDLRAFITLLDTDSDIFCVSSAAGSGCRVAARSDAFLQYAAGLGITAAF